ncbi:DUF2461 domain-containing protein [Aureliella helgolandensis]|uniref:TIGR02453 family protein n=1 Tax=Aureliella helgolandensis TaxID=2527968 RepID=A0A518G5T2_9BACT|nr:DUF2461 domain-containing protein [Aureliella helgolandensis]QDV23952.1 hypothetical protein Q31a_22650 [Aureliella helgolandensis]
MPSDALPFTGFPCDTIDFLADLGANNTREWFSLNKARYEQSFLAPSLKFIAAMEKPLQRVAPLLKAEPKKMGGSLMRIYKDTRFSKDKTPYKTNIGIHFRHQLGKDVHSPGVYLHIAPDGCFMGAGIWRPDSASLSLIRERILQDEAAWTRMRRGKRFRETFELHDDRLKTAPRGIDRSHPQIEDLRLKSFIAMAPLSRQVIQGPELIKTLTQRVRDAQPLMLFLAEALGHPY